MEAIITAATVMAMYLSATANPDSPHYYNADVENGQVKTMYVFAKGEAGLAEKAEYRYTYDDFGRVQSKTTLGVDASTGGLRPVSRLDYTYTAGGCSVEHSSWNSLTGSFNAPDSRTDYIAESNSVMSVTSYRLIDDGGKTFMTDNFLVMQPFGDYLFAHNPEAAE